MEAAPLTLAHAHARNAALETRRSNPVAASEEHDLAAAEFASAAQGTSDLEALRILNLLEQHHKQLGQILRSSHERPAASGDAPQASPAATASPSPSPAPLREPSPPKPAPEGLPSPERTVHPPRLPRGLRPNARELSSSIVSNLASARGIPSGRQKRPTPISPLVSNQHADGHNAEDEARAKSLSRKSTGTTDALLSMSKQSQSHSQPSWAPPTEQETAQPNTAEQTDEESSDAPFQQFYATFENLISKLSAPLAFAGLPLATNATTATPASPAKSPVQASPKPPKTPARATPAAPSIDYSQLISRAALRAVSGPGAQSHNPAESFYVVPTTGGTISYAEIMNRVDREEARGGLRHHRQPSNLSNISEDNFVDAESMILPHRSHESIGGPQQGPGRFNRRGGGGGADEAKVDGKTMEEIALANHALRQLVDTLSRRLHVFEMSAQTSSAALAQSIRSLQRSPFTTPTVLSPENSRGKSTSKGGGLGMGLDLGLGMGVGMHSGGGGGGATAGPVPGSDEAMAKRIAELEEILRKSDARLRKKDDENAKLRENLSRYKEKWENLKAGAKARREREREVKPGTTAAKAAAEKPSEDNRTKAVMGKPGPSGA
ncbi:hypothetical protein ABEF92_001145 [Exophiala dermatitidis]|uniref:Uncharacterized protein n=1 Tax=Exophiala dermatitidis (strain ATCC 34100 / CBS 525.76 / NIH/UT8656) TaxID=858893 RepID=H6BZ53_EXODN|nr:uncharacterized protein HMPREF1120_04980 [Exophiala dermatitidis NIH/UT8656]EHY56916.1 hypothetical protein HMPREF1120_04980 [Exophiala dermatitidis NIH/UT8656]